MPVLKDHSLELFINRDGAPNKNTKQAEIFTFKNLLTDTSFVSDIKGLLKILEKAYQYPIDVEFTANYLIQPKTAGDYDYRINIVQRRPFLVKGGQAKV